MPPPLPDIDSVQSAFADQGYVADRDLATAVFLSLALGRPLLLGARSAAARSCWWCRTDGSGATRDCSRARWQRSGGRATACSGSTRSRRGRDSSLRRSDLQAALPYVDELVPAASVSSLEELAERLGTM